MPQALVSGHLHFGVPRMLIPCVNLEGEGYINFWSSPCLELPRSQMLMGDFCTFSVFSHLEFVPANPVVSFFGRIVTRVVYDDKLLHGYFTEHTAEHSYSQSRDGPRTF